MKFLAIVVGGIAALAALLASVTAWSGFTLMIVWGMVASWFDAPTASFVQAWTLSVVMLALSGGLLGGYGLRSSSSSS